MKPLSGTAAPEDIHCIRIMRKVPHWYLSGVAVTKISKGSNNKRFWERRKRQGLGQQSRMRPTLMTISAFQLPDGHRHEREES
uniref:Uncharacterized protein n=1 Tax=Moniliophthora roreri TaxID=221103 RepID=A0A0W0FRB8_MONRR